MGKDFWKDNQIRFSEIPQGRYLNFDWKETDYRTLDFSECRYLIIWHHQNKDKNFHNLPDIDDLEYLEINWSSSISLNGLSKYQNLKRLELHYCTKIESLNGIEDLNTEIEYIHIDQSKKIKDHNRIVIFSNLRTLCFNDCGVVEDIEFISELKKLEDFRFVNTNVLDGQLLPLIDHPKLKSVGFLNKRHYSHKCEEIDNILLNR